MKFKIKTNLVTGIVMGLLSYVFLKVCTGRHKELSVVMYILAVLFVLKYLV